MKDPEQEMLEFIRESRRAPKGPSRVALLEQAVRVADSANDVFLGMRARTRLIEEAASCGAPDKLLVAFAWCLAQRDKNAEQFDETDFFWQFKGVCGALAEFPAIPRDKIDAMLADMERRYQRHGYGLRPVCELRSDSALAMGELKSARKWFVKASRMAKDFNNDCAACVAHQEVKLALRLGDYAWAKRAASSILKRGGLKCAHKPHVTYCLMARPTHTAGEIKLARTYATEGYRLTRSNPEFIDSIGELMSYHAAAGSTEQGLLILERHIGWLVTSGSPLEHWWFYLGARELLGAAHGRARAHVRKLGLPRNLPIWRNDGRYAWVEIIGYIDGKLDALAAAFDSRNGNDAFSRQAAQARSVVQ